MKIQGENGAKLIAKCVVSQDIKKQISFSKFVDGLIKKEHLASDSLKNENKFYKRGDFRRLENGNSTITVALLNMLKIATWGEFVQQAKSYSMDECLDTLRLVIKFEAVVAAPRKSQDFIASPVHKRMENTRWVGYSLRDMSYIERYVLLIGEAENQRNAAQLRLDDPKLPDYSGSIGLSQDANDLLGQLFADEGPNFLFLALTIGRSTHPEIMIGHMNYRSARSNRLLSRIVLFERTNDTTIKGMEIRTDSKDLNLVPPLVQQYLLRENNVRLTSPKDQIICYRGLADWLNEQAQAPKPSDIYISGLVGEYTCFYKLPDDDVDKQADFNLQLIETRQGPTVVIDLPNYRKACFHISRIATFVTIHGMATSPQNEIRTLVLSFLIGLSAEGNEVLPAIIHGLRSQGTVFLAQPALLVKKSIKNFEEFVHTKVPLYFAESQEGVILKPRLGYDTERFDIIAGSKQ